METMTDKVRRYAEAARAVLEEWCEIPNLEAGIRDRAFIDEAHGRFAVISEGWERGERIHHVVIDLEIIDGKVWVQADNTDSAVARKLEARGVAKTDIVLGFRPPDLRAATEYAAA